MATYTVKAPDGKTVTLQGPDGASQSDIIAQAQQLYTPQAAAPPQLYAGKDPATVLRVYNGARDQLAAKFTDPTARQKALDRFDSDPRAQAMRKVAGLAPLSTAQGDVQAAARKSIQQRTADAGADIGKDATATQSASAGISRGTFGLPEMLAAAGERFLPSAVTGNNTDASYSNILQMIRSKDEAALAAHLAAGIAGEVAGSVVGLKAIAKPLMAGATRLAAAGVPVASRIAQAVENVGTLRKGQTIRNVGRAAVAGAGVGAVQATGDGGDVGTGAAVGAATGGSLQGVGSLAGKFLLRPAADILGLSNAGSYIKRFTSATVDEIKQKVADFRAQTGADPTLFEVLPLADRNSLIQNTVAGRDPIVEQVSKAVAQRTANVQPEMADTVNGATQQQRLLTQRQMVGDLASANGGVSTPGDASLALRASQSPTDMLTLRREESRRIMAPHDSSEVVPNASDLIPQYPVTDKSGTVKMRDVNPEISRVIRAVSGGMSLRPKDAGINVREVTDMVAQLREAAGEGNVVDRSAANAAAHHLMDVLQQNVPEAADATQQMRNAYAAHSRMAEGLGEGWQSRLRDEIQTGTSNSRAQSVTNAYDTDEGVAGRQLGQTNRLASDLGRTPESAVRTTIDLARNGNPAVAENLGQTAADQIQGAAQAQTKSVENLASALKSAKSGEGNALSSEDLAPALLMLSPHTFVTTKMRFLKSLMHATILPDAKARVVSDMLFSQDPRLTNRAMNLLNKSTKGRGLLSSLVGANVAASSNAPDDTSDTDTAPPPPAVDIPSEPETAAPAPSGAPEPSAATASPYAPALKQIYQNENPDLINLVQRVKAQESHGDQSQVSKKGAVGVMQVEPDTGPEAAKLAGVQWDPKAFRDDPAYNEILGIAYLSQQLRKYKGNVSRALAAYNAGPDRTDDALSSGGANWLAAMPAETQDYIAKVG